MNIVPICDKCRCTKFNIVRIGKPELELASAYFGRSRSWWEREVHGISKYMAICNECGEVYKYEVNHDLPVMD